MNIFADEMHVLFAWMERNGKITIENYVKTLQYSQQVADKFLRNGRHSKKKSG